MFYTKFQSVSTSILRVALFAAGISALSCSNAMASVDTLTSRSSQIPADFPQFTVPRHTAAMEAVRDLYWHHYEGLTPKATLWDEWLLPPTIWPEHSADAARNAWRNALEGRRIDPDGYVATHQHKSIAHQEGWPFPSWNQGGRGFGWHFSFDKTVGEGWRPDWTAKPEEWKLTSAKTIGIEKEGWALELTSAGTVLTPPPFSGDSHESPFVQLRWRADALPADATPYIEWTTDAAPEFSDERRFYFAPPADDRINYTMIPVYRHPQWTGTITGLRVALGNDTAGGRVTVQALFSQYDTRHDVNNPSYVSACVDYFHWTRDLNFLRDNIERMRLAMRYMETEFGTASDGIVTVPWVGHEGTTGIVRADDGSAKMLHGFGVGNNYWDLLPFGQKDSYATIRHYGAARKMGTLEKEIATNPGWNIPTSPLARPGQHWNQQADMAKENGNRLFWNDKTGRFTLGIDSEGGQADYGFTFLNLEAIAYGFATEEHARQIMDWVSGKRTVSTDTAQTTDIYHWRFAPRATTLRNTDHYGWFWNGAASIPFGGQVQDGGAVLGFSYHDIMARLKTYGPDDAANRLAEIATWYRDVVNEGGYRAYYDGTKREGTMQGGGTAGGLGLDREFFESVMVPHVMLAGFLGFEPAGKGFKLDPRLPSDWPSLTIDHICLHDSTFEITVTSQTLTITPTSASHLLTSDTIAVELDAEWQLFDETATKSAVDSTQQTTTVNWDLHKPLTLRRHIN